MVAAGGDAMSGITTTTITTTITTTAATDRRLQLPPASTRAGEHLS
jgi:hypothetical protein